MAANRAVDLGQRFGSETDECHRHLGEALAPLWPSGPPLGSRLRLNDLSRVLSSFPSHAGTHFVDGGCLVLHCTQQRKARRGTLEGVPLPE